MYNIQANTITGRQFYVNDRNVVYTCIGYGDAQPESTRLVIVGTHTDPKTSETIIRSFRACEVKFIS